MTRRCGCGLTGCGFGAMRARHGRAEDRRGAGAAWGMGQFRQAVAGFGPGRRLYGWAVEWRGAWGSSGRPPLASVQGEDFTDGPWDGRPARRGAGATEGNPRRSGLKKRGTRESSDQTRNFSCLVGTFFAH